MAEDQQEQEQKKPTVDEILSKIIGNTHYRVMKLKELFDNLNDMVHYYLDKFGPYMPENERKELAILALEADSIFIELSELVYSIQVLRAEAQVSIDRNEHEDFAIPASTAEHLEKRASEVESEIERFSDNLRAFIEKMKVTAERDGIE